MSKFMKYVYETVTGQRPDEGMIPGAVDLFAAGKRCEALDNEIFEASCRLQDRLGSVGEAEDVSIIIHRYTEICRLVGYEMYRCGALFGRGEAFVRRENIHPGLPKRSPDMTQEEYRELLDLQEERQEALLWRNWEAHFLDPLDKEKTAQ